MSKTKEVAALITVPAVIISKFNIAMTNAKMQEVADAAAALEYNEDNLVPIANTLKDIRSLEKKIDEVFKLGKESALQECRNWDLAKNSFLATINNIKTLPQAKYDTICREVEVKRINAEREKTRLASIRTGIEQNKIKFANDIANCKTSEEITNIERLINLEKSRDKYEELKGEAAEAFTLLNEDVRTQKLLVKEMEALVAKQKLADESGDDETYLAIAEKLETKETEIAQARIEIQESVLNTEPTFAPHEEVYNTVKASRTTWKAVVVNEQDAYKKNPELFELLLIADKIKEKIAALKSDGKLSNLPYNENGEISYVENGIKYFESKKYA